MSKRNVMIFIAALTLLAVAVFFASDNFFSPYVSLKEARKNSGKSVQIIGRRDNSVPVAQREGELTFTVIDREESRMKVIYRGAKPQNFDQTEQVVMLGKYSPDNDVFAAESILVKCPSKYRRKQ